MNNKFCVSRFFAVLVCVLTVAFAQPGGLLVKNANAAEEKKAPAQTKTQTSKKAPAKSAPKNTAKKSTAKKKQPAKKQQAAKPRQSAQVVTIESRVIPGLKVSIPEFVYDGEAYPVRLEAPGGLDRLTVVWNDKRLPIRFERGRAICLLPVPLTHKDKTISFAIQGKDGKSVFQTSIPVKAKSYVVQSLKVEPKYVEPDPKLAPRLKEESRVTRAILDTISPENQIMVPFVRPVPGGISSTFGVKRVFNGKPRSQHKGLDLRGAQGTPIRSMGDGKVVLVAEHYYSGNLVIVDHGLGVYSFYCHLSKFKTKEGVMVKAGEVLGLVGSTGRVTGPHLHLGLYVLGQPVDPDVLMMKDYK